MSEDIKTNRMVTDLTLEELREHMIPPGSLAAMSANDMKAFIVNELKTQAYASAMLESRAAARAMTDWEGLAGVQAVSQPWRISNMKEAETFAKDLLDTVRTGASLVIVVAVSATPGAYAPWKAPEGDPHG